jgi:CDP-glycerol glycerophosphotransferase (TagB/SpsB family)
LTLLDADRTPGGHGDLVDRGRPVPGPRDRPVLTRTGREKAIFLALRALNRVLPKQGHKVVLHSIPLLEDGVASVLEALSATRHRAVILDDAPGTATSALPSGVAIVPKRSARGLWHYLTARYVFTTHGLFGDPPTPPAQQVVNLWHGEPPVKIMGRYEGEQPHAADVAPVLSVVGQAYRCTEFGLHPRNVPVLGAPRNDRMLRSDRDAARRLLLGDRSDRPTYLWMPTYRVMRSGRHERLDAARRVPGVPFDEPDLRQLDCWLCDHGARIVVKLHPLDAERFTGQFDALNVLCDDDLKAAGLSVYRSLSAFDGLITDASSIWIDYLLLDRPVLVAFPDVDEYRAARGLNMEPYEDWVPGPFVTTIPQLVDVLGALLRGEDAWAPVRRRTARQLHYHHDAGATHRLLRHLGMLNG